MNEKELKSLSKFLSLVLRHQPELIGIEMDSQGWVDVETLMNQARLHGRMFSLTHLQEVVHTNDKQRFAISEDGKRIRANQGHSSAQVKLEFEATEPPERLFHGTVTQFLEAIQQHGLLKMSRQHVHLSADLETAHKVGGRRGKPVILLIQSGKMHREGHGFFRSENGVWLTDHVPAAYIEFP